MGVLMGRRTDGGGVLIIGLLLSLSNFFSTAAAPSGKVALTLKKADSRHERVSPALEPASDKQFFKKDYPYDVRPDAKHAFDHPYPAVQDSEDFSADYVKDENGDGGKWAAQMEYDTLRSAIRQKEKEVQEALRNKEAAKRELDEAISNEAAAEGRSIAAEGEAKESESDAKKADDKLDSIDGGASNDGKIDGATSETESKTGSLEDCEKELKKAQNQLKDLKEEKKKRDAAAKAAQSEAESKASKDAATAAADEEAAEKGVSEAEKKAMTVDERVSLEQKEYAKAQAETKKWQARVDSTEAELKQAEGKVKALRRDPSIVDSDGGVYRTEKEKSGSARIAQVPLTFLAILAASRFLL